MSLGRHLCWSARILVTNRSLNFSWQLPCLKSMTPFFLSQVVLFLYFIYLYKYFILFLLQVSTEGFTCCEMQDGRPWTYQVDLYGAAAVAHTLLWGTYMNVAKTDGRWHVKGVSFKRYLNCK